ncbi:DUF3916 domain-containing protein [Lysobacter enzymogenes]|uniref:DUF3916 domain-containing protein n=1 Tax=Lysobacter enzymogenes TaxID=69 RepID=UPI00099D7665|nr:DUF3916 domain-containing protein [Lysobacter enzymogenes]UZW61490.1 DUF3916 domain-containing protein [Lysobacter enzymogenes]
MARSRPCKPLPYRLHALHELERWAAGFAGRFPSARELSEHPQYWNWKLPFDARLLQGENAAAQATRRECAQRLIDACAALLRTKPAWAAGVRVTCTICVPEVWGSELCIYLDEDYWRSHVEADASGVAAIVPIQGRSLASEWGLALPLGLMERGVECRSGDECAREEQWRYGEVAPVG